jgi:diguanylate cyclase (GGDEF)-like protein
VLVAALLVATFIVFEIDIFEKEGETSQRQETIELDEVMFLGALLAVGLLAFAVRVNLAQKREMARRVEAERRARELAFQDGLTGLPNRRQFDDALKEAVAALPRAGAAHAVLLLDLNGFKQINDVHGHAVGDEVLIVVAQRLLSAIRDGDLVARLGGDEFVILARHASGVEAVTNVALRVMQALQQPVASDSTQHQIGAGIGIALIPHDGTTVNDIMRKADVALYRAKAERRSALRFFEPQMDEQVRERDAMERALREAVAANEIRTTYQPSVGLQSGRIFGFEARLKWVHPQWGEVPPERFLAIAEEAGLIHEIAARSLVEACTTATAWPGDVTLSVDLYPGQLKDPELEQRVITTLNETGLSPRRLEIEITESALVQSLDAARELLSGLRALGVRIALDNFGTGYSNLFHLLNVQLDKIKIDRRLIEMSTDSGTSVVRALVGLGAGLGLTVAADGIDETRQSASLLSSGCELGQGQLFGATLTAEETLDMLKETASRGRHAG